MAAVRKAPLRAVAKDERPPAPVKPKTITQAAADGTTRELLVAMRDRVALDVESKNTAARDLSSLTKRLMELVHDIEALDARSEQEATKRDDAQDEAFDASAI
jgi:hypothetical protein